MAIFSKKAVNNSPPLKRWRIQAIISVKNVALAYLQQAQHKKPPQKQ